MAFDVCVLTNECASHLSSLKSRDFVMNEVRCFLLSDKLTALQIREKMAQAFLATLPSDTVAELSCLYSVTQEVNISITGEDVVPIPQGYTVLVLARLVVNGTSTDICLCGCVADELIVADKRLKFTINIEETKNVFSVHADFDGAVVQGLLHDNYYTKDEVDDLVENSGGGSSGSSSGGSSSDPTTVTLPDYLSLMPMSVTRVSSEIGAVVQVSSTKRYAQNIYVSDYDSLNNDLLNNGWQSSYCVFYEILDYDEDGTPLYRVDWGDSAVQCYFLYRDMNVHTMDDIERVLGANGFSTTFTVQRRTYDSSTGSYVDSSYEGDTIDFTWQSYDGGGSFSYTERRYFSTPIGTYCMMNFPWDVTNSSSSITHGSYTYNNWRNTDTELNSGSGNYSLPSESQSTYTVNGITYGSGSFAPNSYNSYNDSYGVTDDSSGITYYWYRTTEWDSANNLPYGGSDTRWFIPINDNNTGDLYFRSVDEPTFLIFCYFRTSYFSFGGDYDSNYRYTYFNGDSPAYAYQGNSTAFRTGFNGYGMSMSYFFEQYGTSPVVAQKLAQARSLLFPNSTLSASDYSVKSIYNSETQSYSDSFYASVMVGRHPYSQNHTVYMPVSGVYDVSVQALSSASYTDDNNSTQTANGTVIIGTQTKPDVLRVDNDSVSIEGTLKVNGQTLENIVQTSINASSGSSGTGSGSNSGSSSGFSVDSFIETLYGSDVGGLYFLCFTFETTGSANRGDIVELKTDGTGTLENTSSGSTYNINSYGQGMNSSNIVSSYDKPFDSVGFRVLMDFNFNSYDGVCVPCVRVRVLKIGVTTIVSDGTTALSSDYFWVYSFDSSTSSNNWYDPNYYADSSLPTGIGDSYESMGESYLEVIMTNGSTVQNIGQENGTFRVTMSNSKPEIYFTTPLSADGDSSLTGVIIKFNPARCSPTSFQLPSDLYTISGTTVTWNTSHPLYNILYGKTFSEV